MRGRLTLVCGVAAALMLMLAGGCPQVTVDSPDTPGRIDPPVDVDTPISVFLSTSRPRLIRGNASQGQATLTARVSGATDLRWSYVLEFPGRSELENFSDIRGGLIEVQKNRAAIGENDVDINVTNSVTRDIVDIVRDPGLLETRIRVRVEAFRPSAGRTEQELQDLVETPADRADVVLVLARSASSLTVTAASEAEGGVTLEPALGTKRFDNLLVARMVGGSQFPSDVPATQCRADGDACCRFPRAGDQLTRYQVTWRQKGTLSDDPVCLLQAAPTDELVDSITALDDDALTGVVTSRLFFARPAATGNVAFEVEVTDAAGNSATSTVNVDFATREPLTVADAAPASPLVAPGKCVNLQANGQGGSGSYTIQFRTPRENLNDPNPDLRAVHGRLAPGQCTSALDTRTLVPAGESVRGATASFWAVKSDGTPDRGSVLITAVVSDGVSEDASTSFPIEMRADKQLSVDASFDVTAIDLNRFTILKATVGGGTSFPKTDIPTNRSSDGYMVCFRIELGPSNGTLACENISGFSCFLTNPGTAKEACVTGKSEGDYKVRYNASNIAGSDAVRVTLRDFFAEDELTRTANIAISPVGSQGGGGTPGVQQCPGGFVNLLATPADPLVCVARTDNMVVPPTRLSGSATAINASTMGGTAPFTYTFTLVGVLPADLAPGEGLGAIGAVTTQVSVSSCANGALNPSSTAQGTYFAPDTRVGNRTVLVTVKDQASPTDDASAFVEVYSPTASAGPDRVVTSADPLPTSLGGAPSGSGGDVDPLTFVWTDGPNSPSPGGTAFLVDPDGMDALSATASPNPLFDNAAAVGIYDLCLTVNDATGCTSAPDCLRVTVNVPGNCDDGNPCTMDAFVNNQCQNAPFSGTALDPTSDCRFVVCNFGFPSVPSNLLSGTACGSMADTDCDNPDTCDGLGVCLSNNAVPGTVCDAGMPAADVACEAQDTCDNMGQCVANFATQGTPCDDGVFCDGADTCLSGVCTPSNVNPCMGTTPACDEGSNMCVQCTSQGDCPSDGMACNGPESCNTTTHQCQSGPPVNCNDNVPCTMDSCNQANGACTNQLQPNTCLISGVCIADGMLNSMQSCEICDVTISTTAFTDLPPNTPCADEVPPDLCTDNICGSGQTSGVCLGQTAPNGTACNVDGDPCTFDTCMSGVCNAFNTAPCDDGDTCTTNDVCAGGVCAGDDCDDGLFCNGDETCVAGACMAGLSPGCTGTTPMCDEMVDMCVCEITQAGDSCDDGLFCNGDETCVAGACMAGQAPTCVGQTPECSEALDMCVECLSNMDCGGNTPTCNVATGVCF